MALCVRRGYLNSSAVCFTETRLTLKAMLDAFSHTPKFNKRAKGALGRSPEEKVTAEPLTEDH